ncbi:hypothetical protein Fmac_001504 [Flemingia macrophylla]|uniref:Uncharacterized protein n=1 Tax=Flemingia macrophylla TaxID=520843 RepID=A0ABD1NHA9_9FABA
MAYQSARSYQHYATCYIICWMLINLYKKHIMEASQMDQGRSGPSQVNGSASMEEGSPLEKEGEKPDSPKTQHAIASNDSAQAPKRQRTESSFAVRNPPSKVVPLLLCNKEVTVSNFGNSLSA